MKKIELKKFHEASAQSNGTEQWRREREANARREVAEV